MLVKKLKKIALIFAGTLSLTLAIVGIFIPLLPTTPLLLLASFCYIRSSKRLYNWLINHKWFGTYIYNYMTYGAIHSRTKTRALILLWFSLVISMIIVDRLVLTLLLAVVGVTVSIHILSLKTFDPKIHKKTC
ncbi:YbaN family protein [bacterium AH-315-E09]|nr:YbaN family protein [bacterium AH-315-E09]